MAVEELNARMARSAQDRELTSQRLAQISLDWASFDDEQRGEFHRQAAAISLEPEVAKWYPIQAFLTAVANISKALWGQHGKHATARESLRTSLGVPDSSPLQSTSMRNHFDHFDDRLDEWWGESPKHAYVDLSFGDMSTISTSHHKDVFRSYNPATGDIVFWGMTYNIPTLVVELRRLKTAARQGFSPPT